MGLRSLCAEIKIQSLPLTMGRLGGDRLNLLFSEQELRRRRIGLRRQAVS